MTPGAPRIGGSIFWNTKGKCPTQQSSQYPCHAGTCHETRVLETPCNASTSFEFSLTMSPVPYDLQSSDPLASDHTPRYQPTMYTAV